MKKRIRHIYNNFMVQKCKIWKMKLIEAKKIDVNKEYAKQKNIWEKYVKEHDAIKLPESNTKYMKKLEKIYKRTILLYPLLQMS